MEIEPQPELDSKSPLLKVTPLSKYLAMALFIVMPFVGGWIGYRHAPEKIVEVDQIVYKDPSNNITATPNNEGPWLYYFNPQGGYSIDYPSLWLFETKGLNGVFRERMLTNEQDGFTYDSAGEEVMRISIENHEPGETIEEWYAKNTDGKGIFQKMKMSSVWRDGIEYEEKLEDETWTTYAMTTSEDKVLLLSLKESVKNVDSELLTQLPQNLRTPPGDIAAHIKKVFTIGATTYLTYDELLYRAVTPTCFGMGGYCTENSNTVLVTTPARNNAKLYGWYNCEDDTSRPGLVFDAMGVQTRCELTLNQIKDNLGIVYWLQFDDEGYITDVVEQYAP